MKRHPHHIKHYRASMVAVLLIAAACGGSPNQTAQTSPPSGGGPSNSSSAASGTDQPSASSAGSPLDGLFRKSAERGLPKGLVIGGDCPHVDPAVADQEIAAQAAARIPLKEGLTFAELWNPTAQQDCG